MSCEHCWAIASSSGEEYQTVLRRAEEQGWACTQNTLDGRRLRAGQFWAEAAEVDVRSLKFPQREAQGPQDVQGAAVTDSVKPRPVHPHTPGDVTSHARSQDYHDGYFEGTQDAHKLFGTMADSVKPYTREELDAVGQMRREFPETPVTGYVFDRLLATARHYMDRVKELEAKNG